MSVHRILLPVLIVVCMLFALPAPSQAAVVLMEQFTVIRNDVVFFNDGFNNGLPPPNAPNFSTGVATTYLLNGTMGPESGGKLTLDTNNGQILQNVTGIGASSIVRATLGTSTIGGPSTLRNTSTLRVQGIFDLGTPLEDGAFFGIRLSDALPGVAGNDIVRIAVHAVGGNLVIRFSDLDDVANTSTIIGGDLPLETNHRQILLSLEKESATSNVIKGKFGYIDTDPTVQLFEFIDTTTIFNGETFTRAQFFAAARVPEPATLFLVGLGCVLLLGRACKMQPETLRR